MFCDKTHKKQFFCVTCDLTHFAPWCLSMAQGRLPVMRSVPPFVCTKGAAGIQTPPPAHTEQTILVEGYMTIARGPYVESMTRAETVTCPRGSDVASRPALASAFYLFFSQPYSCLSEEPLLRANPLMRQHRKGRPPAHRSFSFYVKADAYRRNTRGRNTCCCDGWKQT